MGRQGLLTSNIQKSPDINYKLYTNRKSAILLQFLLSFLKVEKNMNFLKMKMRTSATWLFPWSFCVVVVAAQNNSNSFRTLQAFPKCNEHNAGLVNGINNEILNSERWNLISYFLPFNYIFVNRCSYGTGQYWEEMENYSIFDL